MARRTPEEAAQTRQQLLITGLRLFSRHGVETTTLKQISRETGVTHGALYWHFRNRADLLLQIHHGQELPFETQYLEQRQGAQQDALAALYQYIQGVLAGFARDESAAAVYQVFYLPPTLVVELEPLEAELQANRALWLDQLRFFLKQARKQKQLNKRSSPKAIAFTLQNALEGLLQAWLRSNGSFDLVAQGRALLDLLLGGVAQK